MGKTPTLVSKVGLVVHVTGAAPTGQVFNADTSAFIGRDKNGHADASLFLFDTENCTIDGWSPAGRRQVGRYPRQTVTQTTIWSQLQPPCRKTETW